MVPSDLPAELLEEILTRLPIGSLLSLRQTSNAFFSLIPFNTYQLFARTHSPITSPPTSREWVSYLSLLERDDLIHSKLTCSHCSKCHHPMHFSLDQQHQPGIHRYCLGSEDKAWVCPCTMWSMREVRKRRRDKSMESHPRLRPLEPCRCLEEGRFLDTLSVHVSTKDSMFSGILGKARDKLLLNRSAEGEHVRLRDSAEKYITLKNCPDLGCEGTEFQCRWC